MSIKDIYIRNVTPDDAEELLKIYAPYVERTAITFEYEVPTLEEFRGRICDTLKKYPYLAATDGEKILGYAYIGCFKGRAAYDWSAETTIYLAEGQKRKGIGKILYKALEDAAAKQNILNLNACIGYPREEDEYLTKASVLFHERMGYRMVGCFHNSGYKFDRWYDMVWMEKFIGEHTVPAKPVLPYPEAEKTE
ncbi:MAG: GNAT family N-acetyltransferase [Eubacteriales bacterium]|nr:GNAT family N-acetyltransferase [Eubacteriales bacterium]